MKVRKEEKKEQGASRTKRKRKTGVDFNASVSVSILHETGVRAPVRR